MTRHALLIGIDQYPLLRQVLPDDRVLTKDLRGCVNDAELVAKVLREQFGFADAGITLLRNQEASRSAILTALESVLSRLGTDDHLVFFYAGHGSQMLDREHTKPSGWDETIVPADSGRGPYPNRDITDDELRLFLWRAAQKTHFITLIFDCCHSGTLHRNASDALVRSIERDERPEAELPPSPLSTADLDLLHRNQAGSWLPRGDHYVAIAACGERELAAELPVPGGPRPVQHGALTHFLVQQMRAAPASATYRDVFECAAFDVTNYQSDQHPAAEGALDRALFGNVDHPPATYVVVVDVFQGQVTLAAGEPEGIQMDSIWALFPPGTQDFSITDQPRIRITEVAPRLAIGELLNTDDLIETYSRAVLAQAAPELRWPIAFQGPFEPDETPGPGAEKPSGLRQSVHKLLQGSPWLRLAQPGERPVAQVQLLAPHSAGAPENLLPQLGVLAHRAWAAVDPDGDLLIQPLRLEQTVDLLSQLEHLCRKSYVAALAHDSQVLNGLIRVRLLRQAESGAWIPIDTPPEQPALLPAGTRLLVELTNTSCIDLYMALLQIDEDVSVVCRQLYPPVGRSEPLHAQSTALLGDGEGDVIRLSFPVTLPPKKDGSARVSSDVLYKLFVMTQPCDLRRLAFDTVCDTQLRLRVDQAPLGPAVTTKGDRGNISTADWTTVSILLRVNG